MNTPTPPAQRASLSPTVRIVSRGLRASNCRTLEQAARSGQLETITSADVLAPERLPQLASRSLWMLIVSAAVYALTIGLSRQMHHSGQLLGYGPAVVRIALLITFNILGYVLMIPAHEAVHALVILALGGRPRFGLKLPFAAYCTAPDQLFLRNGYLTVALAPLVGLSVIALLIAALAPDVAPWLLLAVAGNFSGAVGDLEVVRGVAPLREDALVADLETGYIAYYVVESQDA